MSRHELLLTLSGEIFTKSRRTSRWFRSRLLDNLRDALERRTPAAQIREDGPRILVDTDDVEATAGVVTTVMGVQRADLVRPIPADDLDDLVRMVRDHAVDRVRGRTFAVRIRRRGEHDWSSPEAARAIGSALLDASAGVDLDHPEVEVQVEVYGPAAYLVDRTWDGAGGIPVGTQERVLSLLSGGFDSPVAAWMMLRRGCPVDFVHFTLECAASDHALVTAHDLWRRWGAGTSPLVWKVDFQPVKKALFASTPPRLRQVVLKQLMFRAADRLAEELDVPALVTGESVGQVSSQTLTHLAEIDRMVSKTVLRPLAGFNKQEIIDRARAIGTASLSERAKEVCDLSDGPVAVAARTDTLDQARADLPEDLVTRALAEREVVALEHWRPGHPLVPVVGRAPAGVADVPAGRALPQAGPVALHGAKAPHTASRLLARGREVYVVTDRPAPDRPPVAPASPAPRR